MSTVEKKKTNHLSNMLNSESYHSKSKSVLQDDLSKKKKLKSTNKKGGGAKEKPKIEEFNSQNGLHSDKKCCLSYFFSKHKIPFILILVSCLILVAVIIFFLIYFSKIQKKKGEMTTDSITEETSIIEPIVFPESDPHYTSNKIKKEFNINTKVGDLKRISVIQVSKDETKLNGETIASKITRKTNYDIYFKSEEDASEDNKYYSKMYKGVVSIRSECTIADGDDCQEKPLVDLTAKSKNIRVLTSEDLKDVPIPLCTFDITDNDVITTITCPESLPENKRNEIILDLYFFRPPAVERADKQGDNITLTIKKENKLTKIHETNGGFCNIYNNLGSKCTTDMNTTLDQEGNLLFYDEEAITIINYDEKNSYLKNKKTNLVDISGNITKSE